MFSRTGFGGGVVSKAVLLAAGLLLGGERAILTAQDKGAPSHGACYRVIPPKRACSPPSWLTKLRCAS